MPQFIVSASHPVRPGFRKMMEAKPESGPAGGFYVSESALGCGKTYATAESAIRGILADHAYSVTMLRPVESADMPAAEDCPSVKWRMVESGHWRATANGREIWAFRSQPGSWQYGTAEGREDVASTGGAGSVTDAKRYAVALANALPADAKPLPVLNLGERRDMWPEDSSLPDRAWIVRFYRPASRPAPAPEVTSKPEGADTSAGIRDHVADVLAQSRATSAAMLAQYKPRNVPGLYSWSHFEHADGSAYQIRHGSEWRGVILAAGHSRREYDNATDMLAALCDIRAAADYAARLFPEGWTLMMRHDAAPSANHRLRVYVMGGDNRVHLAETLESASAHMLGIIARDCGATLPGGRDCLGRSVVRLEYIAPELESPAEPELESPAEPELESPAEPEAEAEAAGRAAFRAGTPRAGYPYGSPLNDGARIAAWLAGYDAERREYDLATDSAAEADAESFVPDPEGQAEAASGPLYVVRDTQSGLYWNHAEGMGDLASADRYTAGQRDSVRLPIGGEWQAEAEAADMYTDPDADDFPDPSDIAEAEAELAAWFDKVDSALAILGEPAASGGEREAYPEAGLTDRTADDFALYLATEYRPRRAAAGDYVAAFRTTDGTQFIGDDGVHADTSRDGRRFRTAAEAEEAAREACRKLRDAGEFAGMARAVRVSGGEG